LSGGLLHPLGLFLLGYLARKGAAIVELKTAPPAMEESSASCDALQEVQHASMETVDAVGCL
jgi:hypothetical protein